ncbi:Bax inhibitor-1/YccA family protein [Streptomyces sp. NPDC050400]|uniref:Bax inhibitor-1/YccA family protein n=1 Tax=Streptomyces sp. NPDC050400 TaxID=3365610 RepID=UPI003789798B
MRSSNPIFTRRGFGGSGRPAGPEAERLQPVGAAGAAAGAADPSGVPLTNPYAGSADAPLVSDARRGGATMTIDDVVVRTAATLGTVVLTAALSWVLLPVDAVGVGRAFGIGTGAALVAFVLSMVQTFRRTPAPALILGYAAFEGVLLGVISSATSTYIAPGVVVQAVLGTMAVFAGVLIAYKRRWIRVTRRFQGFVLGAATGFLLLMVVDLLFSAFGAGDGLGFDSGATGVLFGVVGIVLGACFLALDFKQVEDGIAYGAPREDSWFAAFGLTVTLVWIYLETLRLLSILRGDN